MTPYIECPMGTGGHGTLDRVSHGGQGDMTPYIECPMGTGGHGTLARVSHGDRET